MAGVSCGSDCGALGFARSDYVKELPSARASYNPGSMKRRKSKSGAVLAGGYLLLTLAVVTPLIREGYIGHGNGPIFLIAAALTAPLSVILLLLSELFSDVNAFHMTGWPYLITLCELGAGALFNARLIYWLDAFIRRKWHKA